MAGITSNIQLISNALILLGDAPISSLDEPGAGAIAGANLYESSYRNLLSLHRWRFAVKKAMLSKLSTAPLSEYSNQFQMPTDIIKLIRVDKGTDFDIFEDKIFSNYDDIIIDYVYRVDEGYLPAWFVKTFEFFLAAQFAIPVTGNSTRAGEYLGMYTQQLKVAKHIDSSERPAKAIPSNPFMEARLS